MFLNRTRCTYAACACLLILSSCTTSQPDQRTVSQVLNDDLKEIYQQKEDAALKVTLEEAIARGIKYNLDTKVAQMEAQLASGDLRLERLAVLPSLTGKVQEIGRSNPGAGSSLSVLSGTQSVEPSVSTEQHRSVTTLETTVNLLDIGLGVARANSAKDREMISQERRRKVFQNVVKDVYSTYWNAVAAQEMMPKIEYLLTALDGEVEKMNKAEKAELVGLGDLKKLRGQLLAKRDQLLTLKEQMILASVALKTLIAIPLKTKIEVDTQGRSWHDMMALPKNAKSLEAMEKAALTNRPELREEFMNRRIAMRDVRTTIFETFPGADLVLSYNKDKNQFLMDEEWFNWTATLTQSVTRILTLPARYNRAKSNKLLADERRRALIAAILTQVHVADARYNYLRGYFKTIEESNDNNQGLAKRARSFEKTGMMNKPEMISAEVDACTSEANMRLAYARAQDAYAQLINTVGVDIWNGGSMGMEVGDLAALVKNNLAEFEEATLEEPAEEEPVQEPQKEPART